MQDKAERNRAIELINAAFDGDGSQQALDAFFEFVKEPTTIKTGDLMTMYEYIKTMAREKGFELRGPAHDELHRRLAWLQVERPDYQTLISPNRVRNFFPDFRPSAAA